MRIGRTLPPAAAPLQLADILSSSKVAMSKSFSEQSVREELKNYFDKKYCFFVSSGKAALCLTLQALQRLHPERDQVLIPAYTCYSVPSAIVRAGLAIVLCDIELSTLDYDYEQLQEKLANPRLLAVLSTHLFGLPAHTEKLRSLLQDPRVTIIEDAAQAMGAEWNGKKLGTIGDVGFFSLGRGKALTAINGGIILTDREKLGQELTKMVAILPCCTTRQVLQQLAYAITLLFLIRPVWYWIPSTLPFLRLGETIYDPEFPMHQMSTFQLGLLRNISKKIDRQRQARKKNIAFWGDMIGLRFSREHPSASDYPDLIRFPVLMEDAHLVNHIVKRSGEQGLGITKTYPYSINGITELTYNFAGEYYPQARQAARDMITLPVHAFINDNDRSKILSVLSRAGVQLTGSA
ncbi:MAG: DegT/DnrJ/EryC1/StrS family aminotransferase [Desulfobulbaceae bacterium]|nr:DegT/DnrJ/EryC1/StrS family aminotransferase [Desulfobulbaceae bacterium]